MTKYCIATIIYSHLRFWLTKMECCSKLELKIEHDHLYPQWKGKNLHIHTKPCSQIILLPCYCLACALMWLRLPYDTSRSSPGTRHGNALRIHLLAQVTCWMDIPPLQNTDHKSNTRKYYTDIIMCKHDSFRFTSSSRLWLNALMKQNYLFIKTPCPYSVNECAVVLWSLSRYPLLHYSSFNVITKL